MVSKHTCAAISARSGSFLARSRFRRINMYTQPPIISSGINSGGSQFTLNPPVSGPVNDSGHYPYGPG